MKIILLLFLLSQLSLSQIYSQQKNVVIKRDSSAISVISSQQIKDTMKYIPIIISQGNSVWDNIIYILGLLFSVIIGFILHRIFPDKTIRKQNFENVFFNMLEHQYKILNNISHTAIKEEISYTSNGMEFFWYINDKLKILYNYQISRYNKGDNIYKMVITDVEIERIIDSSFSEQYIEQVCNNSPVKNMNEVINLEVLSIYTYKNIYKIYLFYLGPYFLHFNNILKFLDDKKNEINKFDGDISFYTSLLKSRMSPPELLVLFYHGLANKDMKNEIIKYNLIEYIQPDELIDEEHIELYKKQNKEGED